MLKQSLCWKTLVNMNGKSLGLLAFALILIVYPQQTLAKQVWLKCIAESADRKPIKAAENVYIIKIDYGKERFEIIKDSDYTIQGKAVIFTKAIQFEYDEKTFNSSTKQSRVWIIDRNSLNYSAASVFVDTTTNTSIKVPSSGSCKLTSAPSAGKI